MNNIDNYLEKVSEPQKVELNKIRRIVRRAVPEAEETISYGMPAFKYKGQPLIYFAAFKNHLSIFPTSGPIEVIKNKLGDYEISKGTIKFTLDNPIPESIIKELVNIRLKEISKI